MQLIPLGPGFAVEARGVGLADVVERDDAYRAVRAAFEEHSVLLFRGQPVTDELQVAYSKRFGPLELAKVATIAEGSPFSVLTNMDGKGGLVPLDHKEALRARANQLWHTDSCYKIPPALASVLSARTIPPTGGETEFASRRPAIRICTRGCPATSSCRTTAASCTVAARGPTTSRATSRAQRSSLPTLMDLRRCGRNQRRTAEGRRRKSDPGSAALYRLSTFAFTRACPRGRTGPPSPGSA